MTTKLVPMNKWLFLLVVASGLPACSLLTLLDDDDGDLGQVPQIESWEPVGSEPLLEVGGTLQFSVEGMDADSLVLDWDWFVADQSWQGGSAEDGLFQDIFELQYGDASAVGHNPVTVRFSVVDDGGREAEKLWLVDLQ